MLQRDIGTERVRDYVHGLPKYDRELYAAHRPGGVEFHWSEGGEGREINPGTADDNLAAVAILSSAVRRQTPPSPQFLADALRSEDLVDTLSPPQATVYALIQRLGPTNDLAGFEPLAGTGTSWLVSDGWHEAAPVRRAINRKLIGHLSVEQSRHPSPVGRRTFATEVMKPVRDMIVSDRAGQSFTPLDGQRTVSAAVIHGQLLRTSLDVEAHTRALAEGNGRNWAARRERVQGLLNGLFSVTYDVCQAADEADEPMGATNGMLAECLHYTEVVTNAWAEPGIPPLVEVTSLVADGSIAHLPITPDGPVGGAKYNADLIRRGDRRTVYEQVKSRSLSEQAKEPRKVGRGKVFRYAEVPLASHPSGDLFDDSLAHVDEFVWGMMDLGCELR